MSLVQQPVREQWAAQFSQFLLQRGIASATDLDYVRKFQSQVDKRLGQLAVLKGYLTLRDVCYILVSQGDLRLRFGEAAVQRGLLRPEQVDELIRLQLDPLRLFIESVVLARVAPFVEVQQALKDFLSRHKIELLIVDPPAEPAPQLALNLQPFSTLKHSTLKDTLCAVMNLSAMSEMLHRLLLLLSDPDVNVVQVARMVHGDPALCARLLRIVNSAFFGLRGKVGTIQGAITILGINGVRQSVLMASLLERLTDSANPWYRQHWQHSLITAQWAKALLQLDGRYPHLLGDAATAGVLHELGQCAIRQQLPAAAAEIEQCLRRGLSEPEAESSVLGMHHSDIGALLCHNWRFPTALTQAVLYHHSSAAALRALTERSPLVTATNLACRLASAMDIEKAETSLDFSDIDTELLAFHRISKEDLERIAPQVAHSAHEQIADLLR